MENLSQKTVVNEFVTEVCGHKTLGRKMDLRLNRSQIGTIFVTDEVVIP